jgi:hypothetical protein
MKMKWYEKLFCKHEDKVEKSRYYKVPSYFKVEAYKQYVCKDCGQTIEECVLEAHTLLYTDTREYIELLRNLGYESYDFLQIK